PQVVPEPGGFHHPGGAAEGDEAPIPAADRRRLRVEARLGARGSHPGLVPWAESFPIPLAPNLPPKVGRAWPSHDPAGLGFYGVQLWDKTSRRPDASI